MIGGGNSTYAQIAGRADIADILQSPTAKGRPYIAHATDEPGTSTAIPSIQQYLPAPNHITAVRAAHGKFARYAFWKDGTIDIDESEPVQYEAYNYDSQPGRLELDNIYSKRGSSRDDKALVRHLDKVLDAAMQTEIQAPVPPALQPIQEQAFTEWFSQPPATWSRATDN